MPTVVSTKRLRRGRPSILCVEDEDTNVRVFQLALGDRYDIVHARDAEQVLEYLQTEPTNLSVVLMDVRLQGSSLDGLQLTRLLTGKAIDGRVLHGFRKLPPLDAPIIFITAYGTHFPEAQLLRAGAVQVLAKPVDPTLLQLAVATHRIRRLAV